MIQSQLAILTSSLDCVIYHIYAWHASTLSSTPQEVLDPKAPAFVPAATIDNESVLAGESSGTKQYTSDCSEFSSKAAEIQAFREPLDAWLFMDRKELANISQTCRKCLNLVKDNTPFFNISAEASDDSSNETHSSTSEEPDIATSSLADGVDPSVSTRPPAESSQHVEAFLADSMADFAGHLQKNLGSGCKDMVRDALHRGCTTNEIERQFLDITDSIVDQAAARMENRLRRLSPTESHNIDTKLMMRKVLLDMLRCWMDDARVDLDSKCNRGERSC